MLSLLRDSRGLKWQMTRAIVGRQTGINVHEQYEVEYWSKELGVTPGRLRELVAKHGVLAADVRRAVGK